jgi:hypothetical protein
MTERYRTRFGAVRAEEHSSSALNTSGNNLSNFSNFYLRICQPIGKFLKYCLRILSKTVLHQGKANRIRPQALRRNPPKNQRCPANERVEEPSEGEGGPTPRRARHRQALPRGGGSDEFWPQAVLAAEVRALILIAKWNHCRSRPL